MLAAGRLWDEAKNVARARRASRRGSPWPVDVAGAGDAPGGAASRRVARCSARSRARARALAGRARDLRAARALRAVRAVGARGGARRLRARARRHPEPARGLGRRGALRRRPTTTRRSRAALRRADRRPGAPRASSRAARATRALALHAERDGRRRTSTLYARVVAPRTRRRRSRMRVVALLPLAGLRLEPRQRALPARRRHASCSRAATTCASTSRATAGAARTSSPSTASAPLAELRARLSRSCAARCYDLDDARPRRGARRRRPRARARVERPRAGARASAQHRARGGALPRCSSTTRTTASVTDAGRDGALRPVGTTTACSPSASVIRDLYLRARLGARAPGPGTRRPTRASSARCRGRAARATSSGSATGATTSARAELHEFLLEPVRALGLHGARLRRALPATRRARALAARRHRVRAAGCRTTACPRSFARYRVTVHVPRRPYVAGAARHPDDPRRSRRWPAASRWSRAPWDDAEGLFTPGRGLPRRARRRARCSAHLRDVLADRELRARARRARAARRSSRATPAPTASTSCSRSRASSASTAPAIRCSARAPS